MRMNQCNDTNPTKKIIIINDKGSISPMNASVPSLSIVSSSPGSTSSSSSLYVSGDRNGSGSSSPFEQLDLSTHIKEMFLTASGPQNTFIKAISPLHSPLEYPASPRFDSLSPVSASLSGKLLLSQPFLPYCSLFITLSFSEHIYIYIYSFF